MSLEEINKHTNNKKQLLNNLNDFVIQIDYFDQNGIKKQKNKIPLKDYLTFALGAVIILSSFVGVVCLTYFANC